MKTEAYEGAIFEKALKFLYERRLEQLGIKAEVSVIRKEELTHEQSH